MASKLEEAVARHDREIAAIRKLVLQGMKMLVRIEAGISELQAAQKKTDSTLQAFIRSLERGRNGHSKSV